MSYGPSGIPYWRTARSPHFTVLSDGGQRRCRRLCSALEGLLARLQPMCGRETDVQLGVIAFGDPGRLDELLEGRAPPGAAAAYDPRRGRLLVDLAALDDEAAGSLLAHQLAHALLRRQKLPPELEEQTACRISAFIERSDRGARAGTSGDPAPG
jgi:hypothetical protein